MRPQCKIWIDIHLSVVPVSPAETETSTLPPSKLYLIALSIRL